MDKITRWVFMLIAAALLMYACCQFLAVQQNLQYAGACLDELKKTADHLAQENEVLSRRIAEQRGAEQAAEAGAAIWKEKKEN